MLLSLQPHPTPAIYRRDALFAVVLTSTLVVATLPFFAAFSIAAIAFGVAASVTLHRLARRPTAAIDYRVTSGMPTFNVAAIHVDGDAGGLIFVFGSIIILVLSIPVFRWFLAASTVCAFAVGVALVAWRRRHPGVTTS